MAGLHRLLRERERLAAARVIIVVAGMEGALPSVVAGLVGVPVDRGADQRGLRRQLRRDGGAAGDAEQLCAGVSVVNIDNGFGGGGIASQINHLP